MKWKYIGSMFTQVTAIPDFYKITFILKILTLKK